ncbi:uncharacterized protein A4U43_C05F24760 [Asparagus officinalis]|uniref:Tf2-1-like SH3-like domain-containing protein n=1 Tax=Asparagus officinalis TaxID=4686 RepID=A0A5P1EUA2_ASPOF|nr:uncharacterized protein A4U43_C05F24760 [Asparagus officinalis]
MERSEAFGSAVPAVGDDYYGQREDLGVESGILIACKGREAREGQVGAWGPNCYRWSGKTRNVGKRAQGVRVGGSRERWGCLFDCGRMDQKEIGRLALGGDGNHAAVARETQWGRETGTAGFDFEAGVHGSIGSEHRAKEIKKLLEQVKTRIEKVIELYKKKANKHCNSLEFKPGDLVWLHLRKERFPTRRKNKLMARGDDPFKVIEKVGSNAYKLELPGESNIFATFNIGDLTPYLSENEDVEDLRTNPNQGGENDAKATMTNPILSGTKENSSSIFCSQF